MTDTQIVGGIGPTDCKIAFVGEALGVEEARLGEPFVSASGRLLIELLNLVGILRTSCYVTNVIKERPKGNNIKQFVDITKKYPIETQEYKHYKEILRKELNDVQANVIVAVGGVALYALTGLKVVSKRRGSVYESDLLPGRKVISIIHPSAAIRQYTYKYFIIYDLLRVKRQSEFPEMNTPKRHMLLQPSFIETMDFLAKCKNQPLVAFDIEVKNEEISCYSFAYNEEEVICIPLVFQGKDYFNPEQEVEVWRASAEILEDENIKKLAQNAFFDASFVFNKYGIATKNIEDTMVAQAVTFPDFPKGLDFLTSVFSLEPYYKDMGKAAFKET